MELKLNVYDEKNEVVKTYTTETFTLKLGIVEDLLELVDVDAFETGSDAEIIKAALKLVRNGFGSIKELLKGVFVGITDDELKNTNTIDVVGVVVKIVKYSIGELSQLAKGKNV